MTDKEYYVYIMTNKNNTVIYTGVTRDLWNRVEEHRSGRGSKFAHRYKVNKLVYAETFSRIEYAIAREKQIKGGSRQKKTDLIEQSNPLWRDLRTG